MSKKIDKEYINKVEKKLHEVMYEEPGAQDWMQFSLSVRQAMLAAATVYGSSTDEQKYKLRALLAELVCNYVLQNLQQWDIRYSKRND